MGWLGQPSSIYVLSVGGLGPAKRCEGHLREQSVELVRGEGVDMPHGTTRQIECGKSRYKKPTGSKKLNIGADTANIVGNLRGLPRLEQKS